MSETTLKNTPLHAWHCAAGARMVDFSGWEMPIQYAGGILQEHLETRRSGGIFDVSHMGRFLIKGKDALHFLRYALTNDAALLEPGLSQYTIIADDNGCAVDDAYLCQWHPAQYTLVVNAGNLDKDWNWLQAVSNSFDVTLEDISPTTAMIAVQGPQSAATVEKLFGGTMPAPKRNALAVMDWDGVAVHVSRTGYTGEPVGYEIISPAELAVQIWESLAEEGFAPIGLGARDTLRLEAGLPLHGHEFGKAPDGTEIPILSCPLAKFAVRFSPDRGEFMGHGALLTQKDQFAAGGGGLKRTIPFAIAGRKIARHGTEVRAGGKSIGWVTSGTMVPYWHIPARYPDTPVSESDMRTIGLALVDACIAPGDELDFMVRGKVVRGVAVSRNLIGNRPPCAVPVLHL